MNTRKQWEDALALALYRNPEIRFDFTPGFSDEYVVTSPAREIVAAVLDLAERETTPLDVPTICAEAGIDAEQWRRFEGQAGDSGSLDPARATRAILEDWERQATIADLQLAITSLRGGGKKAEVLSQLMELTDASSGSQDDYKTMRESAAKLLEMIQAAKDGTTENAAYLPLNFPAIERLGKWWWGDQVVIAARTGKGKTTLALNIARRLGQPVLIHSLEMTTEQNAAKLVSDCSATSGGSGVSVSQMLDAGAPDWTLLDRGFREAQTLPIFVNDRHNRSHDLLRISRKAIRREGVRLVIVDHLQLVQHPGDRRIAIGEISSMFRNLALSETSQGHKVVVLLISQLTRPAKGQENKPPTLYDLKESGDIENDATAVLLLHHVKGSSTTEIIAPKQRMSTSEVHGILKNRLAHSRFEEV